ncbi:MAG: hypothetical protein EAZ36_02720 [Verrucomicrobia bacterium]|nr:MAG: hypothetical protein EAZ36_02720 [Verrucomicrobiota bacterium]
MSDTPSPLPPSDPAKPRLSLVPKTAAAPAAAPSPVAAAPSSATPPSITQASSDVRPPALTSSGVKPSFKLQGTVHSAADQPSQTALPTYRKSVDDSPSPVLTVLSALAAAAAISFAALLYLKTQ